MLSLSPGDGRVLCSDRVVALFSEPDTALVEFMTRPCDDLIQALLTRWRDGSSRTPHVVIDLTRNQLVTFGPWILESGTEIVCLGRDVPEIQPIDDAGDISVQLSEVSPLGDTFLQRGNVAAGGFRLQRVNQGTAPVTIRLADTGEPDLVARPQPASESPDGPEIELPASPVSNRAISDDPEIELTASPSPSEAIFDDPEIELTSLGRSDVLPVPDPAATPRVDSEPPPVEDRWPTEPDSERWRVERPDAAPQSWNFREPPSSSGPKARRTRTEAPFSAESPPVQSHFDPPDAPQAAPPRGTRCALVDFGPLGLIRVSNRLVVGRNPARAQGDSLTDLLVLDDRSVSRVHAQLFVQGDDLYVQDLGSANSSQIHRADGGTIDLQPGPDSRALQVGDSIQICSAMGRFVGWESDG